MATGLEKPVFIPTPKKGNAKECSNYPTIALISHASKLEPIIQSEVSQKEKHQYSILTHIYGI